MSDGGLRGIFRKQFSNWQWTPVETAGSASGVPDSEFCTPDGIQGWVEFKQTKIFYVQVKPLQVAWCMRRWRYGGNVWVAVRRTPRQGGDELWLMNGGEIEALKYDGLEYVHAKMYEGGPSNWNFEEIGKLICRL